MRDLQRLAARQVAGTAEFSGAHTNAIVTVPAGQVLLIEHMACGVTGLPGAAAGEAETDINITNGFNGDVAGANTGLLLTAVGLPAQASPTLVVNDSQQVDCRIPVYGGTGGNTIVATTFATGGTILWGYAWVQGTLWEPVEYQHAYDEALEVAEIIDYQRRHPNVG